MTARSLDEWLALHAQTLRDAGVADPVGEMRRLSRQLLKLEPGLVGDQALSDQDVERLSAATAQRAARRPMSHILGRRAFWNAEFVVTPNVLDPRPETEGLVETVLAWVGETSAVMLDLGVGSGAILLSVLSERPTWRGLGIDRSCAAIDVARANARRLGVAAQADFLVADWCAALAQPDRGLFDVIVSNPPYIPSADILHLEPEVAHHEPRLALDGGRDGLAAYRVIADQALHRLRPGGLLALEVGVGQAHEVAQLIDAATQRPNRALQIEVIQDASGRDRLVCARHSSTPLE